MSQDLAVWLLEQIDRDEQLARNADPGPWFAYDRGVVSRVAKTWPIDVTQTPRAMEDCQHIARWNPQRVLAECEAKRRIIASCREAGRSRYELPDGVHDGRDPDERERDEAVAEALDHVLLVLVQPYQERPGWRQEWGT